MTHAQINEMINDFGEATRRAIEAGFDGVEIHGANILITTVFSPHSNRRKDSWEAVVKTYTISNRSFNKGSTCRC